MSAPSWTAEQLERALVSLAGHHVQLCHGHELGDWVAVAIGSDRQRCHGWGRSPVEAVNALERALAYHGRVVLPH